MNYLMVMPIDILLITIAKFICISLKESLDRELNPRPLAYGNTAPALREQRDADPFYKNRLGSMTRVVRSAPQYPARNPLVNHTTTKVF
jgi:hypothetical protein